MIMPTLSMVLTESINISLVFPAECAKLNSLRRGDDWRYYASHRIPASTLRCTSFSG